MNINEKADAAPTGGQHTPLPWFCWDTFSAQTGFAFGTKDSQAPLGSPENNPVGFVLGCGPVAEANAKLIVAACNCHEELVSALQSIVYHCNPDNAYAGGYIISKENAKQARAAIAKAEGRTL